MTTPINPPQEASHRALWKWFLAFGTLLLVLGITGISMATLLELSSLLVFGPLLLASSLMQLILAFIAERRKGSILHFIAAVLEMVVGFAVMMFPPDGVVQLVSLIAIFLVVSGLIRLSRLFATPSRSHAWTIMTAVVALLLGITAWLGGLAAKLWLVGLFIAVDYVCHGVSWMALGMERKPPASSHEGQEEHHGGNLT